jgi:hypothetical protein
MEEMMSATQPAPAPLHDSLGGQALLYKNEAGGPFSYTPATLTLSVDGAALLAQYPTADGAQLLPPDGWHLMGEARLPVAAGAVLSWTVQPAGLPASCRQVARCQLLAGDAVLATLDHPIAVELRGESRFDPVRDIPPFRNSTADLGAVEPREDLFSNTYRPWGMILPDAFFRGLYRDIVFLASGTDARGRGGLCTGMARFALGNSLEGGHPIPARVREVVQIWHGRQLTDAALLASAIQFLTPDTAGSYRRFRDQVLHAGEGTVAFDVGIARWSWSPGEWPAIIRRVVTQGHTIVPYAFQQTADDSATVQVYDPSHPSPEEAEENVVRFDLARGRYAYRGFGALDRDDQTTVLAVTQRPFSRPGTAFLASLASLVMHPEIARQELRTNTTLQRGLSGALVGGVGLLAAGLWRGRRATS